MTGATDTSVPFEISPVDDPETSDDIANVYLGDVVFFIQKMPATRTVTQITLGDFRSNDACDGQEVPLLVLESDNGEYGVWHTVAGGSAHIGVQMGRVTWSIPATTFQAGKGYAFDLDSGDFAPCSTLEGRSWAHNSSTVNPGPDGCAIDIATTAYTPPRRYWHEHGASDVDATCANGFDIAPSNFDPSMPTGWLNVWKPTYSGPLIRTNTATSSQCPTDYYDSTGEAVPWPEQPGTSVCEYPEFAPRGQEVTDGWYYGIANGQFGGFPWHTEVRDLYVRLENPAGTGGSANGPAPLDPTASDMGAGENSGAPNLALGQCACADPINPASGNLVENVTDLSVAGRGVPLTFARTYDSLFASNPGADSGNAGAGWSTSWSMHLQLPTATDPRAVVHNDNGSTVPFVPRSDGSFAAPNFVTSTLASDAAGYQYTLHDGTAYQFDANGQLRSVTDHNGYVTSLAYNATGQLTSVTNQAGRALTLDYNADGHLQDVTDPLGRKVSYGYDADGNLTSATDPAGGVTRYGYDSSHELTSLTDQDGHTTTTSYDSSGRAISQTDAEGETTQLSYAANQTTVTDPRGVRQVLEFGGLMLTSETDALGTPQQRTITFEYDAAHNLIERDNGLGKSTTWTYDALGDRLTATDELARKTTFTYTSTGHVATVTDPVGETTSYSYDAHDNVTDISRPLAGSADAADTHFVYDPDHPGDVNSERDPSGRITTFAHDAAGYLTAVTDGDGNTTSYTNNPIGWRTSQTSPRGNAPGANAADFTTSYTRDPLGRLTAIADHLGRQTKIAYDAVGNRTSVTDPAGNTTSFHYDKVNRLVRTVRPDQTEIDQQYDADGHLTASIDGLGHTTSYQYDPLGHLIGQTDPLGRHTSYSYDAADRRTAMTDANGESTSYAYDAAGELTAISYSDPAMTPVSYGYDGDGRRTTMSDATGQSTFAYDSLGRLTSVVTPGPVFAGGALQQTQDEVDYHYDLAGRITQINYPSIIAGGTAASGVGAQVAIGSVPSIKRRYDNAGRLIEVDDFSNGRFLFSYDADGQITHVTNPNFTGTTLTYDHADQLTDSTTTGPDGTLLDLPYTSNQNGLTSSTTATAASNSLSETYGYDALNQLTDATIPTSQGTLVHEQFAYDAGGRTTTLGALEGESSLSYDNADELTSATDPATGTQLTSFGYDADGQRTTQTDVDGAHVEYHYNQAGELIRYRNQLSTTVSTLGFPVAAGLTSTTPADSTYAYNGQGLRSDLLWDYSQPIPQILEDATHLYITGPGGLPLEQVAPGGAALYYHHDRLGSTRLLSDPNGHAVAYSDYDPYGRPINKVDAALNPLGFAGQYTDPASGLIYMRARWYDPHTGQFLTRDPLGIAGGDRNLYAYTSRDPVNSVDPSGLCAQASSTEAGSGDWSACKALEVTNNLAGAGIFLFGVLPSYVAFPDLTSTLFALSFAEEVVGETFDTLHLTGAC